VSETQRDACRAFCAKCVYLLADSEAAAVPLLPPDGLPAGVDSAAVALQLEAFATALREKIGAFGLSNEAFARLLPMLTVNPALSALSAAGKPPMLQHNRFVLQPCLSDSSLRALTIGYVGMPPGGGGTTSTAQLLLTVASPNVLDESSAADHLSYDMTYALRNASHRQIEKELAGGLALPHIDK